jgi:hypothetical protein
MDRHGQSPGSCASDDPSGVDWRRPEHFFDQPWRGTAVSCDAFGLPSDRCEITYQLVRPEDGPPLLQHRIVHDSGLVNVFEWAILPEPGGRILARDRASGAEARGEVTDSGFHWSFPCRHKTPFGVRRCRTEITYKRLSETDCETSVTITFMGVMVGTAAGRFRRGGAALEAA